jgi:hypothetical protein
MLGALKRSAVEYGANIDADLTPTTQTVLLGGYRPL